MRLHGRRAMAEEKAEAALDHALDSERLKPRGRSSCASELCEHVERARRAAACPPEESMHAPRGTPPRTGDGAAHQAPGAPTSNVPTTSSPRSAPTCAIPWPHCAPSEAEAEAMLWADDQQTQWRRDIEAMQRRLDELDDEEAREVAAIEERYAEVKPHTTAAAIVFALTPEDAKAGLKLIAKKPRPQLTVAQVSSELHRQWLELVDTEGPFLAIPPLKRVWPQGMPSFRPMTQRHAELRAQGLRIRLGRTSTAAGGRESALDAYRVARNKWVETVLRDVAGWPESLSVGRRCPVSRRSHPTGGHRHRGCRAHRPRMASVRWCIWSIRRTRFARHPTICGRRHRSTAWKRCCARTTFRSASSPTAAGGDWYVHARAAWRHPGSSTR